MTAMCMWSCPSRHGKRRSARKVTAPTPEGPIQLTIPAGSAAGRKMRLRGRGLPGTPPGDLYVALSIALPPANTEAEKEAYRSLERAFRFNPRGDEKK